MAIRFFFVAIYDKTRKSGIKLLLIIRGGKPFGQYILALHDSVLSVKKASYRFKAVDNLTTDEILLVESPPIDGPTSVITSWQNAGNDNE